MKRRLPLVRVQPLAYSQQLRQSVLFRLQDVYRARRAGERRTRGEKSKSRSTSERSAIATRKLPTLVWLLRRLSSLNAWTDRVLSFSPVLQPGGRVLLEKGNRLKRFPLFIEVKLCHPAEARVRLRSG